jgi:16S rRNA (uracil1498-N3)-methyltransferase
MNIILLHHDDFITDETCTLYGARALHIRTILKAAVGDTLRVGLLDGLLGQGSVLTLDENCVSLRVQLQDLPPRPLPVTLLLALPRPNMLGRLLRDVTSLGVKNMHLLQTTRVEKSFWQTPVLQASSVHEKFVDGLSQARDTALPVLHTHHHFKDVISHLLPTLKQTHTLVLADPFSPAAELPGNLDKPVALVIGPEGGFTADERTQLLQAGCAPLWLGSRILRVETAVLTALGQLGARIALP